jgi:hypothetical protein
MDKKKSLAAFLGAAFGFSAGRLVDLALLGGTLATAVGAVGFAGYATLASDHTPHINGMKYLAIFAQPSHPERTGPRPQGIDMDPVGAIPAKTAVEGYALVGAQASYGWLREGDRIFAVRPGDDVPRLGHVAAIEQRHGRWALVDAKGAELIASSMVEPSSEGGGLFDRRMIFGSKQ